MHTRCLSLRGCLLFVLASMTVGGLWFLPLSAEGAGCPNESFRTGLSQDLPECRAYELVTPPETNGRLVGPISALTGPPSVERLLPVEAASPDGDSVAYLTYNSPLLIPEGAIGELDVYEAERGLDGWHTNSRLSPSGPEAVQAIPGGVSPDHSYALAVVQGDLSELAKGGPTDYLVDSTGTAELIGIGALGTEPFAEGRWLSEGGGHVIFVTGNKTGQSTWCGSGCKILQLEPDAPPTGTGAIYDRSADGATHVISLLPGDVTPAAGEEAIYKGVSNDGATVAFSIGGILYVRVDNAETLEVAAGNPTYAGLSGDGQYLFYLAAGNIHRFNTVTEVDDQVNFSGDAEIMNVAADGSHIYFISPSQLDGTEGAMGQPNVYMWNGGAPIYVTTVLSSDLERTSGTLSDRPALGNWTSTVVNPSGKSGDTLSGPGAEASRTTPDGRVLIFESRARLTAYENDGHTEIYRYEDGGGDLVCVSCNPLVQPATSDDHLQDLVYTSAPTVIHNVTSDGTRVFFETSEALEAKDLDGVNDIYEWRQEAGGGTAIALISSGQSADYPLPAGIEATHLPSPNVLLSVTPSGDDVVFVSRDALVDGSGHGGPQAIYNARVNGGFPSPALPEICVEEGCKPKSSSPSSSLGAVSENIFGGGNYKPRKRKFHCRHLKHKGHRRCNKRKPSQRRPRGVISVASSVRSTQIDNEADDPSANEPTLPGTASSTSEPTSLAAGLFDDFGIESVSATETTSAAGMHPDFTSSIVLNYFIDEKTGSPRSHARTEEVSVSLPPGLVGNVNAIPRCKTGQLVSWANCPIDSQVGIAKVKATLFGNVEVTEPIYNLEPPHPASEIARFGMSAGGLPVFIDITVRTASDYGATATVHSAPGLTALLAAKTTLWGNPADPIHDEERLTAQEAPLCNTGTACKAPGGKRSSGLPPTAFFTNPSACQPVKVSFAAKSYQLPGIVSTASAPMSPIIECRGLPFAPSFQAQPTNATAGAPTGLKTTLMIPQQPPGAVNSHSTATMREARVTLPEGMTIAAGAADGIAACSEEQVGFHQEVDAACPDASKVGTATISSDLLPHPIAGELFLRTPRPAHLFGLWLVTDELGLHVKIPGELEPNKANGQLTAVFRDLPQTPVSQIDIDVWGGPRAPLANPDACGTYTTTYTFTPHSNDPPVSGQGQMTIGQGCGARAFNPKLHAGTTNPIAGAFSPFVFDLQREDGEQNLAALDITLPDGLLAQLKGVGLCPEDATAAGNCPADSEIGNLSAAAGPGTTPIWLPQPGKSPTAIYLAGPYRGAPFSIVAVVPAQAGPFDLGNVVVRSALRVDPETARATVASDPLPQFVEGVAAVYRRIHVVVDRPGFTLNPTDCSELAIGSELTSTTGATAEPSTRFEVDGCKALKFKPKIALKLKGGTKRSDYPALSATVKARKGDANIGRVSVALPHSEFLAQEHIVTICTRKQFAADKCPKGSVYGKAKAWTPLLAKPLEGPVYLRSSDNPLPDLVMSLKGEIDVALVGRIDSVHQGIRTTFAAVPDAPVTKFVLRMQGGKKGLLTNSQNICIGKHRATVRMRAQNGRPLNSRTPLQSTGCSG